jgi:hypothetical protein
MAYPEDRIISLQYRFVNADETVLSIKARLPVAKDPCIFLDGGAFSVYIES